MKIDAIQMIKGHLVMADILQHYGYEADRKGFICCPFHNEKTPSMRIYEKDYHCFGCGENGDVISFVKKLYDLSFQDALKKIDLDFNLNIYGEHSFEDVRRSYYQQQALQAKQERERRKREEIKSDYWQAFDEWKRLDDNRRNYMPKSPNEIPHPLFIESLLKLDYQTYIFECADERRRTI